MVAGKVGAHAAHDEEVALRVPFGRLMLFRRAVLGHVNDLGKRLARKVSLRLWRESRAEAREGRLDALRDDLVRAVSVGPVQGISGQQRRWGLWDAKREDEKERRRT